MSTAAQAPCLAIGQMIGSYRVVRPIGEGAMGEVYEVFDSTLDRRAALKVVPPWMARDKVTVARFKREAVAASRVKHPGVVHIFEYGALADQGNIPYFIMEYLEGETLHTRMRRLTAQQGCMGVACLPILRQIAVALDAVHRRGLVHRDLKPANVMLVADETVPGGEQAKLLDFGIVKILQGEEPSPNDSQDSMTRQGMVLGTPRYMAPEQWKCGLQIDGKADVYALGVMAFLGLSGQLPFMAPDAPTLGMMHCYKPAPSLASVAPNTPTPLVALIGQMLEKEPAQRPAMAAVADAFARMLPRNGLLQKSPIPPSAASLQQILQGDYEHTEKLGLEDLQWDNNSGSQAPLLAQKSTKRFRIISAEKGLQEAVASQRSLEPSEGALLVGSSDNLKPTGGISSWGTAAAAVLLLAAAGYFMISLRPSQHVVQNSAAPVVAQLSRLSPPPATAPHLDALSGSAPFDAAHAKSKGKKAQRLPDASCLQPSGLSTDQQTALFKAFARSKAKVVPGEPLVLVHLNGAPQLRTIPKSMSRHTRGTLVSALKHQHSAFASAPATEVEILCPNR